ncbi:cytochrome P450 [uncultured Algimonas sp.]|uniref:cytochrome P450 n=1 Tax=uncultured Algimonas sp. TaxID=1547920 RepID=UPI0026222EA6|nr:cytochrome P450 [uncultured Algimonas sp.]
MTPDMGQTRHDYRFRPEPRWDDGRFVPPVPRPIKIDIASWDRIDWIRYMLAASRNPIHGQTNLSIADFDQVARGLGRTFFTPSHPDTLRETFVTKADALRLSGIRNAILKPVLRNGLLTSEGDRWRHDRRALAPVFTPRNVNGFAQGMARTTQAQLDRLMGDDRVAFDQVCVDLTYQVLSDVLFSGELEGGRQASLRDIDRFLSSMGRPDPFDLTAIPAWVPRLTRLGKMGIVKRLRRNIGQLGEARRDRIEAGETVPDDLLTLMLTATDGEAMSEALLVDQLITFIAAGHETTSRALTWLFYLLSQDDAARARLEAEADGLDTDGPAQDWPDALPYTGSCIDEAMRLYPPAPFLSRELNRDETLGGKALPEGTIVFGNLWTVHRHRKLWEHPDAFMPDRFLPGARDAIDRFQYLPFGLGPRVCIGSRFAKMEAVILTALIARRYRLHLEGDHPWPLARVTVRTETPLTMRVERRK